MVPKLCCFSQLKGDAVHWLPSGFKQIISLHSASRGTLLLVSGYSPISCDKLLCRQACLVVRSCLFFPQPRISFRSVFLTCLILVIGSKLPSKSWQALSMDGSATTGMSS
ncbi:hypothetical protein NC652_010813 [Populus alba x Populus x berolinensis]|nr:hypothetical protein NC652_010813 [Populus alba x Populus x berolinensis]